jgi:predicted ATPase
MHELTSDGSQFVISTHSPILLGCPEARILVLSDEGITETRYQDTEQYELSRSFLDDRDRFLHHLFAGDQTDSTR